MVTTMARGKVVPLEEIEKVNVLTDRVKKRKDAVLTAQLNVCSERSRLVTESWKKTEGQPLRLRRAKLFQNMLQGLSIGIRDGELIVGSQSKYVRGASPCIDFNPQAAFEAVEKPRGSSPKVMAILSEEDKKQLLEDAEYWKGKSPGEMIDEMILSLVTESLDVYEKANFASGRHVRSSSGRTLDFDKVINKVGLNGVLREIKEEIDKLDFTVAESLQKYELLKAGAICCEAVINFAHRYAKLAREMAQKEKDAARKEELLKIAENCEWVPANPARTFHEAIQSFFILFLAMNLETASHSESAGRMDQFLYPTYKKDLDEGRITRQEAAELLGCLWVKLNELETIKAFAIQERSMGSQFIDTTLCGVTKDGRDATNELSYLILEVAGQIKMTQPPLYIRYHKDIPEEFMIKAVETNRKTGGGIPCFINDAVTLLKFIGRGVPLTEARDYLTGGCIGVMLPGGPNNEFMPTGNMPKIFELALNDGIDPGTGKRLGPATGDPRNFKTYQELYDALMKQCEHLAELAQKNHLVLAQAYAKFFSMPFTSILMGGCIKSGKDSYQGGTLYPQMAVGVIYIGHQNVADGLTAIKKLVFEEKKITMGELLDALKVNFEGKEEIRQMLLKAPKYGNDDDYADDVWNQVSLDLTRIMAQRPDWKGYPMWVMRGGGTAHVVIGSGVGALPDGRKAYEPLADGNLSPVQGMDVKGPTAVMISATKVNQTEYAMTTLLNMKIMPSVVKTREGIRKVIYLIKTFFDRGGWHVQFNMIDQATLVEAQKHPEQYRSLIVRVGGYSAYFVDLLEKVQNDVISRTQHTL